jgi:putative transposase
VIDALNALVAKHPVTGFWQAYHRLRLAGRPLNHKRVYRIYTALGLNVRRCAKKRLPLEEAHSSAREAAALPTD